MTAAAAAGGDGAQGGYAAATRPGQGACARRLLRFYHAFRARAILGLQFRSMEALALDFRRVCIDPRRSARKGARPGQPFAREPGIRHEYFRRIYSATEGAGICRLFAVTSWGRKMGFAGMRSSRRREKMAGWASVGYFARAVVLPFERLGAS